MATVKDYQKAQKRCLSMKDGKLYYDWTKSPNGVPPTGWPNGIIGRELPEERRSMYDVSLD
jgi:hypothetical protein